MWSSSNDAYNTLHWSYVLFNGAEMSSLFISILLCVKLSVDQTDNSTVVEYCEKDKTSIVDWFNFFLKF